MKYLEQKDPLMHVNAKRVIKECAEKNRQKVMGYESFTASVKRELRKVVPDTYWIRAERYLQHFLMGKAKEQDGSKSAK